MLHQGARGGGEREAEAAGRGEVAGEGHDDLRRQRDAGRFDRHQEACNYPHLSTPNQRLAGFVQIVSICAELFEGPPCQVTLSGSNIDRSRNYSGPCGWSEMWVIASLPTARPAASSARPPSAPRRSRRSSSIRASISPPRIDRQGPPAWATTPKAAVGAPSCAPTARASAPTSTGDAASGTGARSGRSTRSSATSVVGSRPAGRAATASPPGSVTPISPSSARALSAVTTRPGRQTKPVEPERPERTETRAGATPATARASAADRSCNGAERLGSVTGGLLAISDPKVLPGERPSYCPGGQGPRDRRPLRRTASRTTL